MKNLNVNRTRIATIILAVLLISSTFAVFMVKSQVSLSTNALSQRLDPSTGLAYGDLTKYEWPAFGADGGNTRSTAGPAPNSPRLLWDQTTVGGGDISAFDGYVFVRGDVNISAYTANAPTLVWSVGANGSVPGTGDHGAMVKIGNGMCAYLTTTGVAFYNDSTGALTRTGNITGHGWTSLSTTYGSQSNLGAMFDPVSKCFISIAINSTTGSAIGVCIDASNPTNSTLKWEFPVNSGNSQLEALAFGGGNAFFGGGSDNTVYAINIQSGQLVWKQSKAGNAGYSATYYNGVLYQSASSTQITAFDGTTGAILQNFNAPSTAIFAYGGAAEYGRIYDKVVQSPQSWIGCWDAKTLEQQWRAPANYLTSYLVGAVGDGKFYVCTGDLAQGLFYQGNLAASNGYWLSAYDAFTGVLIWSKPTTAFVDQPIIAYGNLYILDGLHLQCYSDLATATQGGDIGWYMFHGTDDITGQALTGTAVGSYPSKITKETWKYQADSPITGSPVVANGLAYFGTFNGTLYCVDANSGIKIWANSYNTRLLSTPTVVGGVLYTGADDGYAYALNATTGVQLWKSDCGEISDTPLNSAAWQVKSGPCYYGGAPWNGCVLVPSQDGNLYCLNATDGTQLWFSSVSTTGVGNQATPLVYKDDYGRTVVYLNANGALIRTDINGTRISSSSVSLTARANTCSCTIWKDWLFITTGSGAGALRSYNASTMTAGPTATLAAGTGAMTYMTQTPTVVDRQIVFFGSNQDPNRTNIGYSGAPYYINMTSVGNAAGNVGNWTRTFTCVYCGEATDADCIAFIKNGDDLGASQGMSPGNNLGYPLDQHWIQNQSLSTTLGAYMIRVWVSWAGHQVYSSASVAIDVSNPTWTPVDYFGNAAYGFTAYNGSTGAVCSTFTAKGQVFSTAALYQNKVYMTSNDGFLYCFANNQQGTTYISASTSSSTVAPNQPMLFTGRLLTSATYYSGASLETAVYAPSVPYATVNLVWTNPDQSSVTLTAKTDAEGYFNFTYTPTASGSAGWLALFPGSSTTYDSLGQSYTAWTPVTVTGSGPSSTATTTAAPTTTSGQLPIIYVYAIAGVVIALVIIIAAVMLLRKRQK